MSQKQPEPANNDETDATEAHRYLAVAGDILPLTLHLLPLHNRPLFPIQTMPMSFVEDPWLGTVTEIGKTPQHVVGLVLTTIEDKSTPLAGDFSVIGTVARMHNPSRNDGRVQFIAEGMQRFRIVEWISTQQPYVVKVEYLEEESGPFDAEVKAYAMAMISTIKELIPLNPLYNEELKLYLDRFTPNQPAMLSFFAASLTTSHGKELQAVLAAKTLRERMDKVLQLLKDELDLAKLHSQIRSQVDQSMSEQQRRFFLKEQLKVIQKELGLEKDDRTADAERFQDRLEHIKPPGGALKRIEEELEKFSVLESGSPEYAVTRNYLDWMTGLPWGVYSEDILDLDRAQRVLDEAHSGLDDVKQRIIEFLAVGKLRGGVGGSILLLVGPPGVGKTSIGRSVAEALGRRFFRFSVGGMRDEAEIKGHRRTYIGAMPGKFVQALKDVEVANPVFMLDEVDKIGASYQGDSASALLEVLDPEQNDDFLDHYLDVRFDLSRALFICTANQLDTIPAPLLDRMEVIRLSGYIAEEKFAIAKQHLWPRQLQRSGIKKKQLALSDTALRKVIDGYAREAGVRGLDKQLGRIIRKSAVAIAGGKTGTIRVSGRNVEDYLGKPLFHPETPRSGVGVIMGLAWTAMGGVTLAVEATKVHVANRGLHLTGNLGEVMRESAEIAYSFVASQAAELGVDPAFFAAGNLHLHIPEGATPKDGPSAGITMASSLVSLARDQKPRRLLAMTGELTLTGEVYPVGGIREKVIAARRAGIRELILPEANRPDVDELPDYLKVGMTLHFANHFRQVNDILFA